MNAELERLIEEQEKDDTTLVSPEFRDMVSLSGTAADFIATDEGGDVMDFLPRRRGDILITKKHGTNICYLRGCRRPECTNAHRIAVNEYRARKRAEVVA
jgi:hypothetical protein